MSRNSHEIRRAAEGRGRRAEDWAAFWLRAKLYSILGRRVRTAVGEIDLIARSPGGILCFIEVKQRPKETAAAEALAAPQRSRIARAAALYLAARPKLRQSGVRFDVFLMVPGRLPKHVKDAWRPD